MPATVSIYHGAFRDEDVNKRVFTYMDWGDSKVNFILDKAFKMFNAPPEVLDEDELEIMEQYRKKQLRSLSVGDVVQVEDVKYVCQSFGWKKKEEYDLEIAAEEKRRADFLQKRVDFFREEALQLADKLIAREKARMRNTGSSQ